MDLLLKGVILGFSIAAPVGPIGILCIQRTLSFGRWYGVVSGLGAATADALYGAIAAFGLTMITLFLTNQMWWFQIIGGVFLIYLGVRTLMNPMAIQTNNISKQSLPMAYGSTLLLTLTNPTTILSFSLIFAGFGLSTDEPKMALIFIGGVFIGSGLWWILLSSGVSLLREHISESLSWINRVAGLVLIGFGVVSLLV